MMKVNIFGTVRQTEEEMDGVGGMCEVRGFSMAERLTEISM